MGLNGVNFMAWKIEYNEDERQLMEQIQTKIGFGTASKAIRHMVATYLNLSDSLQIEKRKTARLERELEDLKRAVRLKFEADQNLKKLLKE